MNSDKYRKEFDMHAKKLSMGISCFHFEFSAGEARRREREQLLLAQEIANASSKEDVVAAMVKVEEEAKKNRESLIVAQVIMKSRERKNSQLAQKAKEMEISLAEADAKVKEAETMKSKIAAAKDDEIAALKQQLVEKSKVEVASTENKAEMDEEEIVVKAFKEEVAIDEEEEKGGEIVSVLDQLVAGNYAPQEAKALLEDLGGKCGWGVSPDGFVLDCELANAINGLLSEAMKLREAMLEEEDETKEEEMFNKAEGYADKAEEIEKHHKNIMLPTAAALRVGIERMIDWGDADKRALANKNADDRLAKNGEVKKKRDLANDLQEKFDVAKKSADKEVRKTMLTLKKEPRAAKQDAADAEFAAGIFRPDDGEEAEALRIKNIKLITAIMVSAEEGEKRAANSTGRRTMLVRLRNSTKNLESKYLVISGCLPKVAKRFSLRTCSTNF